MRDGPVQSQFSGIGHNGIMSRLPGNLLFWVVLCAAPAALAQVADQDPDQNPVQEADGGSAEVEESDEAYRRRMELEDARQRNLGYTLPPESYAAQQEKIDKLPEESRDNIRDQLIDIIVADGEWEPSDALKEYPYQPTEAALADADLLAREQEAWEEQVDKYHKREAAAFGTYLGPVPGPGNPGGQEGGTEAGEAAQGEDVAGLQQGGGPDGTGDGQEGGQEGSSGAAGTYDPSRSRRSESGDEVSTAGTRQSALDFLTGQQGEAQPQPAPPTVTAGSEVAAANAPDAPGQPVTPAPADPAPPEANASDQATGTQPADEATQIDLITPGIIAIEDLDKLEGTEGPGEADGP